MARKVIVMLRPSRFVRVTRLIGAFLILVSTAGVQAALVQFDFEVDVTSREVLEDGGFLTDWQPDTGFTGSGFSLGVVLDTATLLSESGNFGPFYRHVLSAPISGMLSTPFDAELDAVLTQWPGLGLGDASIVFEQRLDGNTGLADMIVRFSQSVGPVGDTPNIIDSTRQALRSTTLNFYAPDQTPLLDVADVLGGALLELQDLVDYVSQPAFRFDYSQVAAQNEGAYEDLLFGPAVGQGVRYDGSGRVAEIRELPPPTPVSVPGAVWLLGFALFLLKRQGGAGGAARAPLRASH